MSSCVRSDSRFDVVVAGGGVAGSAAAAALSRLGYEVAIVEPGLDASRRLAGELVHDAGAAALAELELLPAVAAFERTEVAGFSVLDRLQLSTPARTPTSSAVRNPIPIRSVPHFMSCRRIVPAGRPGVLRKVWPLCRAAFSRSPKVVARPRFRLEVS